MANEPGKNFFKHKEPPPHRLKQYRNVFRRGEALPEGNKAEQDVKRHGLTHPVTP